MWYIGDREAWRNCRLLAWSSTLAHQMSRGIMTSWLIVIWRHTWRHRLQGTIVTSPCRHRGLPSYRHHPASSCRRRTWPLTWFQGHARSRQDHEAWRHRSRATAPTVGKLTCSIWCIVGTFTVVTWPGVAKSTARLRISRLTYGNAASALHVATSQSCWRGRVLLAFGHKVTEFNINRKGICNFLEGALFHLRCAKF